MKENETDAADAARVARIATAAVPRALVATATPVILNDFLQFRKRMVRVIVTGTRHMKPSSPRVAAIDPERTVPAVVKKSENETAKPDVEIGIETGTVVIETETVTDTAKEIASVIVIVIVIVSVTETANEIETASALVATEPPLQSTATTPLATTPDAPNEAVKKGTTTTTTTTTTAATKSPHQKQRPTNQKKTRTP